MDFYKQRQNGIQALENTLKKCAEKSQKLHIPSLKMELIRKFFIGERQVNNHLKLMEAAGEVKIEGDYLILEGWEEEKKFLMS